MHTLSRLFTLLPLLPLAAQPWLCLAASVPSDFECAVSKSPVFDPFFTIYFTEPHGAGSTDRCQRFRMPDQGMPGTCVSLLPDWSARKADTIDLPLPVNNQCWECRLFKDAICRDDLSRSYFFHQNQVPLPPAWQGQFQSFSCAKRACNILASFPSGGTSIVPRATATTTSSETSSESTPSTGRRASGETSIVPRAAATTTSSKTSLESTTSTGRQATASLSSAVGQPESSTKSSTSSKTSTKSATSTGLHATASLSSAIAHLASSAESSSSTKSSTSLKTTTTAWKSTSSPAPIWDSIWDVEE